jgi:hypothetical protein
MISFIPEQYHRKLPNNLLITCVFMVYTIFPPSSAGVPTDGQQVGYDAGAREALDRPCQISVAGSHLFVTA